MRIKNKEQRFLPALKDWVSALSNKMKKKQHPDANQLDREEKMILASFENNEWKSVKNFKEAKRSARKAAAKTLRKDVRINIRLASSDVSSIKQIAAYEGLPYQTLIASVLHKYAAGHLSLGS